MSIFFSVRAMTGMIPYIGEAENVVERLNQHLRDYHAGKIQL
ncbi:hypothetical protein AR1Y2_2155 [Anaerostipes rhamnosivorans]|uniref:GIY-YIG domain-containing protein n=1 Tax=Anaerostipes rhamnosivorans TaxID=1229621 RepID=A0A4P8IKD5_9FIRM|nr:hypothetical protein AR1Y2_2155 [Anaerostipes rhamnosivorans]